MPLERPSQYFDRKQAESEKLDEERKRKSKIAENSRRLKAPSKLLGETPSPQKTIKTVAKKKKKKKKQQYRYRQLFHKE